MELKEFISQSIKQIADGLIEGNKYTKEVAPGSDGVAQGFKKINFDVAVTTNEGEKGNIGGKVSVAQLFNVGGSSENSYETSNYSRIKFEILLDVKTH